MRSTFNILFYINRSKLKADGTTAILCRITIDGSKVVMSTGENTLPGNWSVKRQETNDKQQNQSLHSFREKIEQGYDTLLLQFGAVSAELLKRGIIDNSIYKSLKHIPKLLLLPQAAGTLCEK